MREELLIASTLENSFGRGEIPALATVVDVRGSAYRGKGAKILVDPLGDWVGTLSAGCLEPQVRELAGQVLGKGHPLLRTFDLSDNSVWGLGVGCGGQIEILIEAVRPSRLWNRWVEAVRLGISTIRAVACDESLDNWQRGTFLLWVDPGEIVSSAPDDGLLEEISVVAERLGHAADPVSARELIQGRWVFFDVSPPPWQLIVFGGGDDAIPLVQMAQGLGFLVTVVEPRPAYRSPERFPFARTSDSCGLDLAERLGRSSRSFAVVMNHHYSRDRESLAFLLGRQPRYIGVLGPRDRFRRLLAEVSEQLGTALSQEILSRIHNPVGLDIGAEAPQEVALSIMAEILAVRQNASAGFLRETPGSIHKARNPETFKKLVPRTVRPPSESLS